LCYVRFRAYESSCKPLSDLFDWWERAVGALAVSYMADQQPDMPDDKGAKKAKKAAGYFVFSFALFRLFFLLFVTFLFHAVDQAGYSPVAEHTLCGIVIVCLPQL